MTGSCDNTGATRDLAPTVDNTSMIGTLLRYGLQVTKLARWNGLSRWDLSLTYTRLTKWQGCTGES